VSEAEVRAAWQLYVEYSTRITTSRLDPGTGSAREALESIHSLFDSTRKALAEAGPEVAHGPASLGPLAIRTLNEGVRPFLVRWHTEMRTVQDEAGWERRDQFDAELAQLRDELEEYVAALGKIAGVKSE
jgi:hypothetical protein